jgi:catechol 2,3-dioxygenase-like lactoylglutathione lyase family enzyme
MNLEHHHVGLSVTDLDAAQKWYADVLGMTLGYTFEIAPLGLRGCFMEGHGTRVELLQRSGARGGIGGQAPPDALLTLGFGHIAFRVGDLDATYAELLACGAAPVWDPRPSPEPGVRMAFVADPDGNLVEFISAAPTAAVP